MPVSGTCIHPATGRSRAKRETASFFLKDLAAVALSSAWAFGFTYAMLWLIDRVTPVRVTAGVQETGLDAGLLHEEAYLEGAL